jgi:hypothetical protein
MSFLMLFRSMKNKLPMHASSCCLKSNAGYLALIWRKPPPPPPPWMLASPWLTRTFWNVGGELKEPFPGGELRDSTSLAALYSRSLHLHADAMVSTRPHVALPLPRG